VLAAIYLLWADQRMMQGPVPEEHKHHPDLSLREMAVLGPIVAAILLIGIYPKLLLDRINPSTARVVHQVEQTDPQSAGYNAARAANGGAP
jgi:NADH-quinone oxidoreductase subunit M